MLFISKSIVLSQAIDQSIYKDSLQQYSFAKFLFDQGLYQSAADEFERLVYHHPNNITYFFELLKANRLAGNAAVIKEKVANFPQKDLKIIMQLYLGYIKVDDIANARWVLDTELKNYTTPKEQNNCMVGQLLLEHRPNQAKMMLEQHENLDERLKNILLIHKKTKKKSPLLAGILSTLIPTSGRHYARDHKDAIFSLIFMGTSGFQAYRRFKNNGIESPSGWAYAAIFGGFYTGNIYGSVKAAQRYNKLKYQKVYDGTKSYFDLFYRD
jgi:hypothetical protein